MPQRPPIPPILVLFVGVLATSISSILIRFAQDEAPSPAIAGWRLILASLILLPLALKSRRPELKAMRKADWRLAFFAGAMLGVHFASWITSLAYTSITSSVVLVTTTPLWVGLASPFFLNEPLTRFLKVGIVLALAGSILVGVGDSMAVVNGRLTLNLGEGPAGNRAMLGNGLALIGALSGAAYFMIGRRLRPRLSLLSYTSVVYGTAALFLLAVMLLNRVPLFGYSSLTYLLFLLMAVFPQLLGHSSYNYALAYLSAAYVSVAIISEPIGASVLAFVIFQEIPGTAVLLGAGLILSGIAISSYRTKPSGGLEPPEG
jgi:drug/metabolite transporter (DMT)-like permease